MHKPEAVQALEARRLFAIPVSGGVATINGTANPDVLEVIVSSGTLQVRNAAGTVLNSVSMSGVTRIDVNGGSGNDFIRLGRADGSLMPAAKAVIAGNGGSDTLIGGNQVDSIYGAAGDDRMDGRAGADLIDGGDNFDTADYSYRTVPVKVTLTNAASGNDGSNTGNNSAIGVYNDNGGDNLSNMEAAVGGTGADSLTGNIAANWLDGSGGNDTIYGGAGIDTIVGGVQNDLAYGEGDDDTFLMQDAAADKFLGTPGTTIAQYDAALDSPAPAQDAAVSLAASLRTFGASLTIASAGGELIPDTTFGLNHDGKQTISFGAGSVYLNDITMQPDGKIVAVGNVYYASEAPSDFIVMRFNEDGSLDTSFGDNTGFVFTDFTPVESDSTSDFANSVAIDSQNRIIVAGSTSYFVMFPDESSTYVSDFAIARYLPDGSLDPLFGDAGLQVVDANSVLSYDTATRVVVQSRFNGEGYDDYYLIGGTVGPYNGPTASLLPAGDSNDFGLIRLDPLGGRDTTFGDIYDDGLVQVDFSNTPTGRRNDYLSGLAIDPATGNIWLTGDSAPDDGESEFAVVGYDSSGLPLNFGRGTFAFSTNAVAYDATIVGRQIIVVGSLGGDGFGAGAILAASIDAPPVITIASLAPGTFVQTEVDDPDAFYLSLSSVTVDEDGTGIAIGTADNDFYVYRFDVDTLEAVGSPQRFDLYADSYDDGSAVLVKPDGKYLIAGRFNDSTTYGPTAVGLLQLEEDAGEEWVDINLNTQDIAAPGFFTYATPTGNAAVPSYLVWRYTRLAADGTWTIEGTDLGETYDVSVKDGIITVKRDGEFWQEPADFVTKIVINAAGGNDIVNIPSDFKFPVRVNGGEGDDQIRGGNGPDEFFGDNGNDLILGQGGNDKIRGGKGRDVLIGGAGKDNLDGELGEDVLVAGITLWDSSSTSLQKLMDEWTRTDLNYQKRVQNLTYGGGKNGIVMLNLLTTFSSRQIPDVLTGGGDSDAFWGNFSRNGDSITDRLANEIVYNSPWL